MKVKPSASDQAGTMTNYAVCFTAGCLLCLGLVWNANGIATADPGFRQLLCVFETSQWSSLSREMEIIRLNVRLLLSRTRAKDSERSQLESLPPDNIPSFIVQEPLLDILQYISEDDTPDCRINPYFTANTQIIWPGREIRASSTDSWFTCTIMHTAGKYTTTAFLVHNRKGGKSQNPGQLVLGTAERLHVSVPFLLHSAPTLLRTALATDVWMPCAFTTDKPVDVTIQWVLNQKGGHRRHLFTYNGSSKQVEHMARRVKMVLEEIPKGNASLLLRNAEIRDEGTYSCLVSVGSLTGEQKIELQIEVKPIVTINVDALSLVEGEQHKLVCSIRHYYPHNIEAQWQREPKDSWSVPYVLKNVLSSSHQQSSNGTYSSSRYFLLTASLKDNGHNYTCLVDHQSLRAPIRKSVTVEVREATPIAWLLLLLSLTVCLAGALWYYHKVRSTNKPKPY